MSKYLFVFLLGLSNLIYGQKIAQTLDKMGTYAGNHPQEKIHLHTDRDRYTAGETIWFKSYNTINIENALSILSGVNHVEMIDPLGRIVVDQRSPIQFGVGNGSILLADSLIEGSYRLRAYTNWMRNADSDYFFEKKINITNGRTDNTITTSELITAQESSIYHIQIKTLNGIPIAKKSVRYRFLDQGKEVTKGSAKTDEEGYISIKKTDKNKDLLLHLAFENIDERPVQKVILTKNLTPENSIQLFPEGGHIIAGAINNIAFKILRSDGQSTTARLRVFDRSNEEVAKTESNLLGMGTFTLFASDTEEYRVQADFEDGSSKTVSLPEVKSSGHSLTANNLLPNRLYCQVYSTQDLINNQDIYFVVHHLGSIIYVSKRAVSKQETLFSVEKSDLPSGVITISILNNKFLPILERAFFNFNPNTVLSTSSSTNKKKYATREKVEVTVTTAREEKDSIQAAAMSASVVNISKIPDERDDQKSIFSSLLLEADVKGKIERPGYYFDNLDSIKHQDLDVLMLTQGWRKIDLQKLDSIFQDSTTRFAPEKGLVIKGQAKKLGRKAAVPNAKMQLISTENFMDFMDTTANENGEFIFDQLSFPDTVKFLISAKDEKGKNNIDIIVDDDTPPSIHQFDEGENDLNTRYLSDIQRAREFFAELESKGLLSNVIDIEEVIVRRERPKAPEHSRNLNGPGSADQLILEQDLETCPTLEMCLAGRLLGVTFQGGVPMNTRENVPMQIVLDGMYVEADMLSAIPPTDVASVEVLRNINYTSIYGSYGGNGLLIITTKIGRTPSLNYQPKGLLSLQPKGFSFADEFYKPAYEADSEQTYNKDRRTTIHWEPMLVTDKEGKASFDFYTADEKGAYKILIEGIDLNGRLVRHIQHIEVEEN